LKIHILCTDISLEFIDSHKFHIPSYVPNHVIRRVLFHIPSYLPNHVIQCVAFCLKLLKFFETGMGPNEIRRTNIFIDNNQ
jgi:hypothetical protein